MATKKVRLFEIDHDYLRLIREFNKKGQLFIPSVMGIAGYKSLDRLERAGKIESVKTGWTAGYQVV